MRDLRDFYSPHLTATINGHTFTVECPSAREGLRIRMAMSTPETASELDELAEINTLFGGTIDDNGMPTGGLWDELDDNGVTYQEAMHLGTTAMMYFGIDDTAATWYWENGGINGKGDTPKAETPKKGSKTTS